jgi:NAD(P)-dependent dehydrogenase (short-subunit alcohol dehydrogenase family)
VVALSLPTPQSASNGYNKVAIIAGASSGIGYATSKLFAREGYKVVVAARRQAELDALCARRPTRPARRVWIGLVKALAVELGPKAVRVNAILPGGTDAPAARAFADTEDKQALCGACTPSSALPL